MNRFWTVMATALIAIGAGCSPPPAAPTVDPFVALDAAEKTAQAAQDQADLFSRQLTATAEAPIVEITQTAAGLIVVQTQASINSTATAVQWTPTPTFTPTVVPTATVNIEATVTADSMLLQMEKERSASTTRTILAFAAVLVALFVAVMFGIAGAKRLAMMPTPIHDGTGKPLPVLNVVDATWSDLDRATNGTVQIERRFQKALPLITAERQDATTNRAQQVDLKSRTRVSSAAVLKLLESQGLNATKPATMPAALDSSPAASEDNFNLPLPSWDLMRNWDGTSKPLGLGRNGLILAKAASPHILIAGMTGSGKTLYMMRTLATASLAQGAQVVNIGYSDSGFGVFKHHRNYHGIALPKADTIVECLARVYDELQQRKQLIGGETFDWDHLPAGQQPPRPFLDLFLDELGNMAEDIYMQDGPALNKEMWSLVARIANEGRKFGIRFVAALQDPTSKSMDLRFRRNCTLVAFRQGDRTQSDTFIGSQGAENLPVGHFMARTDSLVLGGGFFPTDIDILEFLSSRKVSVEAPPKWIEALIPPRIEVDENPPLIVPTPERLPEIVSKPVNEIAEMAEHIRPQWTLDTSKTRTAKLLGFPQYGGSYAAKTDAVIEHLTSTTPPATTTERQPEMGNLAPEMA